MDTPSRTTANAGPSQSSTPQHPPTSSNPQPGTPPEESDRRGSPRRISLHTNTSTQASSAVSAPSRSPRSNNLLPPPASRVQNATRAPNPSHSTSRPIRDDTSRATSSNSEDSRNHHHTPRPPSHTPENQAGASSQPSNSASRHTHLYTSTNTPRPTTHPSTVSEIIGFFNGLRSDLSYRSDRSRRRAITIGLYNHLHVLQLHGECLNAEPLGPDWIDIETTTVPSNPPEAEGGLTILDMIVDMVDAYNETESPDANDWEWMARGLLTTVCYEDEVGLHFRNLIRRGFEGGEHRPKFGETMRYLRDALQDLNKKGKWRAE
ncbi:hypothetical protein JMJ35_006432 [Cladonia borealis]|uniref:Uncharacterized protein n=1 Tax=Cladonia borealis TaxID=184061 RepID=A0AA39QX86_9LECA|nr:hypothetical protein JMJ35_006432 [Cladonia borealis]